MNLELTGNETPEEIDALLDQLESDEIEIGDDDAVEIETEEAEEPTVDKAEESAPSEVEAAEPGGEQTPEGVLAKDGKNVIPYDVLEREREATRKLQEELNEYKSRETAWDTDKRLLEIRNKQLEGLGVDPADLPENFQVTNEQLDSLAEDYPEIGPVIRHLFAKVNKVQPPSQVQQESSNPIADAIAENSDLSTWQKEGGDNWSKALEIDDQLRSDPQWSNKPLNERFAKVAEMVNEQNAKAKSEQQSAAKQKAKEEEAKLDDALPNSPSEVGQTNTSSMTPAERLANGSVADIQAMFATMTDAQIEAALAQLEI